MKRYNKDLDYSYTLGVFPTFELLNTKPSLTKRIILSKELNKEIETKIVDMCNLNDIEYIYDENFISKVSDKENCYVVGVFKKDINKIEYNESHLVLVNPSNMGNVGTIIRTMLGFNCKNLAIITPSIDIYNPKVIRASMGSIFSINIEFFDSFDDYIKKFNEHKVYTFMLDGKSKLKDIKIEHPNSLVFGNESSGLDETYIKYNSVVIPHSTKIDSLNLTVAVGISLYEFNK